MLPISKFKELFYKKKKTLGWVMMVFVCGNGKHKWNCVHYDDNWLITTDLRITKLMIMTFLVQI